MKVLVTGANGYLGRGIVSSLLDHNHTVIATDINTSEVDARATLIDANIFNMEDPYGYFGEPDVLLHLAWRDGFVHYSDSHIDDLPKHYHLIEQMLKSGLKHLVVMGSMHEIEFWEGPISENTPCNPLTPYGISKNALRELVMMLCKIYSEAKLQWLRGYYIVGNEAVGSSIFSKKS